MSIGPAPDCYKCIFFHPEDIVKFSCDAFPDGIPGEIIKNEIKHTEPLPEQKNKLTFTRK